MLELVLRTFVVNLSVNDSKFLVLLGDDVSYLLSIAQLHQALPIAPCVSVASRVEHTSSTVLHAFLTFSH